MTESIEYEVFKERFAVAMETWRVQVNSYWTRNSYFALFETAAAAGVWTLFESKHWWTSLAFSIGLIVLTLLWWLNNQRIHEYIVYWWKRAAKIEELYKKHSESDFTWIPLVYDYENNREKRCAPLSYHPCIQTIPVLFSIGWFWTAEISFVSLTCNFYQFCICK